MNNALLYLGGFLVVVMASLFAVPLFVDWNGYRGDFEEEASKVLGRDVRVGGAVNVRFLPTPYVRFEKVRLADPTGQTGESFIRAESFTMKLAGAPLLRGVLEANEIELNKPVLTLALDDKGGGNWSTVQIRPGALPFVPQDVTLRSVKLIDGVVALYSAGAKPIARFDAINGEMSADALKGPFKFKGQATWAGEVREIKFATSAPDASGTFQIKASSRAEKSSTSYFLDGKVEDFSGVPRLTGDLTGKIALPSGESASASKALGEQPSMEMKSRVDANTAGARIDDISLTLDNSAEAQVITGSAVSTWGKAQRLDIALAAKWLDLDRLASAGEGSATFANVKQLGLSLLNSLAGDGAAGAKINIDQIKLGGETTGGLAIDAERQGRAVQLRQLKAGLPGSSRLDLSGDLKDDNGKVSFVGSGFVHGTNIAGLLAWAAKSGAALDIKADGPYSGEGRLLVDDQRIELTEASADIGGRTLSGDVVVSGDPRRRVAVTLEAARLDSSELFPATAQALDANIRRAFGFGSAVANPDVTAAGKANGEPRSDVSLRILTGELKHGDQTFRNVDATVGLEGGNIRIPSAKFTTGSGLVAGIEAFIKSADQDPKGTLAYDFVATTPDALKDLATVFGFGTIVPAERLVALGSAKFAGLVRLGERGKSTADVSVAGTLQAAKISGHAEFDEGLQAWRTAPSRLQISGKAAQLDVLLSSFGINRGAVLQPSTHEAEFSFASSGPIAAGAATLFDVSAPGLDMGFRGHTKMPSDGPAGINGSLRVKADDLRDVLALASLPEPGGFAGISIDGVISIARESGIWSLESLGLTTGGSTISGLAKLTPNEQRPATLSADVKVSTVTVAGLTSALLDTITSGEVDKAEIWPDAKFNFDSLKNVQGDVHVRFDTFQLATGLAAHNGAFKISLTPNQMSVSEISGRAAGGALSGDFKLNKAASGTSLDAHLKVDGAELANLGARSRGKASLESTAHGIALSPAAAMAALGGTGTLQLDDVHLAVPGSGAVGDVVAGILSNKVPNETDVIATALQTVVTAADTDLSSRAIPFTIADGVAKFEPVALQSADGSVTSTTNVDLVALSVESAWHVAAMVRPLPPPAKPLPGWLAPTPKAMLPPASMVFTGSLGALKQLTASVDAADMQRELVVRQTERNIEMLERLKLEDAERVRLEVERRKALEAERAAALAAKAAGLPPPPPIMPPVLPESAGTSPPADAASESPPIASGSTSAPAGAVVESPSGTVTTRAVDLAPVVERPPVAVPRPQPARTNPPPAVRQTPPRRTTSDEVMRSLGGFP